MEAVQLWHLPIVFLAGLIGEGYGTVIGSGGILIQFVLAFLGLPLQQVVASDIAGAMGANVGVISASGRTPWNNKRLLVGLMIPLLIGDIAGALFLVHASTGVLRGVIIAALMFVLGCMFIQKRESHENPESVRLSKKMYVFLCIQLVALGWYGNSVGVGSGTFSKLILSGMLRISVADSIALSQIIGLPGGIIFLIVAAANGLLVWPYIAALWAGSFIGSRTVTRHIRKIPDGFLRQLLVVVTVLYLVYLIL